MIAANLKLRLDDADGNLRASMEHGQRAEHVLETTTDE